MRKQSMILILSLLISGISFAQSTTTETTLFAQGIFSIADKNQMQQLESEISELPYVRVVRLDWETQRAFILTRDTEELSAAEFTSWFGNYAETLHCIQIGVYGTDAIAKYPFTNCEN